MVFLFPRPFNNSIQQVARVVINDANILCIFASHHPQYHTQINSVQLQLAKIVTCKVASIYLNYLKLLLGKSLNDLSIVSRRYCILQYCIQWCFFLTKLCQFRSMATYNPHWRYLFSKMEKNWRLDKTLISPSSKFCEYYEQFFSFIPHPSEATMWTSQWSIQGEKSRGHTRLSSKMLKARTNET